MNKNDNRKDKIKFLKGLATGESHVEELLPDRIIVFFHREETQTYHCKDLKERLTEEDFRKYQKRHPSVKYIVVRRSNSETERQINKLK